MSNLHLPDVQSYAAAIKFLGKKDSKTIGYKTRMIRLGDHVSVFHHTTAIVTYYENGMIQLNNGGWASSTTSNRMHRLTPPNVRVFIKQYEMFVEVDGVKQSLSAPVVIHP